jgi:ArsR family transcriptional regulator
VFKALGSAARLGIVELLGAGEMEVGRIACHIGTDRSSVCKQLTTLRKCGIVSDRKQGSTVFCTLAIPEIKDFIKRVEAHVAKTHE